MSWWIPFITSFCEFCLLQNLIFLNKHYEIRFWHHLFHSHDVTIFNSNHHNFFIVWNISNDFINNENSEFVWSHISVFQHSKMMNFQLIIDEINICDYKNSKKTKCMKKIAYMKNTNSSKSATMRSNNKKNKWNDVW